MSTDTRVGSMRDLPVERRLRRARRRRRRANAYLVAAIVLFLVAAGAGTAAMAVRSDTSDLQSRAEPVQHQVDELTANEENAARRLGTLRTRSDRAATGLAAMLTAYQAQVDASNHAVDVANQAVDQYNSGQADVAAAFQAAGDAAVADLEQKTAAVTAAVAAAQSAVAELLQVANG